MQGSDTHFREDINGLRAVAVIGVILFHLGITQFGGGFLGVDVFFVISGYLITGSIIRDLTSYRFSFGTFYYRRARRLFPALLVTVAASLIASAFILTPVDFLDLGKSAIAAAAWSSNFYFWITTDYFGTDAATKALLHTWSLGVEEQFYLVWPLLLFGALWLARRWGTIAALIVVFAVSAIAAVWASSNIPIAGFFLMPFRIFEFAIGGLVVVTEKRVRTAPVVSDAVVAVALAVIVAGFVIFRDDSRFPVINALVVCAATAAIIQVGPTRYIGLTLSNSVAGFLGKISYSLYLVHWPLVVLYHYAVFRAITVVEMVGLFAVTVALGWVLHVGVEQRFRYYDFRNLRAGRYRALASIGATVLMAGMVWSGQGWAWRSSHYFAPGFVHYQTQTHRYEVLNALCRERYPNDCWALPADTHGKQLVLIVGDSHAPDGFNIAYPALKDEYLILNGMGGCPPVVEGINPKVDAVIQPKCRELNKKRTSEKYLSRFDVVVISDLWSWFGPDDLAAFLAVVKRANPDAKIIVFGNYIVTNALCWQILERTQSQDCFANRYVKSRFLYEAELKRVTQAQRGLFVSKKDAMCDGDTCRLYADDKKKIPFTWDEHHLSYEFAHLLGERSKSKIRAYVYGEPIVAD